MKPRSSRSARSLPIRWQATAIAALVAIAVLFGGGGAEGPINNGIIQALSAVLIALIFASHAQGTWPLPKSAAAVTWLFGGLLLIVLFQLIPLPPAMWQSLPGRALPEQSLSLVGASQDWRPLSLDPDGARRFAASLLLPAAILYGMLGATRREVLLVVQALVIAACVSALVGALQLALSYPSWLTFYEGPNAGAASGVFANANHHATLLAAAIIFVAVMIRADRARQSGSRRAGHFNPWWLTLPFFIVIILATGSRAAIVLMILAVPGAMLIAMGGRAPLLWLGGLAAVFLIALVVTLFSPSDNALAIGKSFIFSEDSRYAFLPDVLYTLRRVWPWGSGLGTFVPVFAPNENLDVVGVGFVNHAHNDLLEWLIETGIAGAVWLVAALALLLWRIVSVARNREQLRGSQFAVVLAGAFIIIVLGLHSLVDYPVRVAAIAAVGAAALGLVLTPFTDAPPRPLSRERAAWPLIAGGIAGVVLAAMVARVFVTEAAIRDGNGSLATMLRPDSGRGLALVAEDLLDSRNRDAARRLASASIVETPLNSAAVSILARTLDPAAAIGPWRVASAMGWRDAPTQLWAFQQALVNGEMEVAAIRADAFLRTRGTLRPEYLAFVRVAAADPRFRAALVERLKLEPRWRANLFELTSETSVAELRGVHALLRAIAASGEVPSRSEARQLVTLEVENGSYAEARDLYRLLYGTRPPSGEQLTDGGFDRPVDEYRDNSTRFDWLLGSMEGGTVTIDEQEPRSLFVETDGSAPRTLINRYVPLDPGTYRLSYLQRGDSDSLAAITVGVRCANGPQLGASPPDPPTGSGFVRRAIRFAVSPQCPIILITLDAKALGQPASANFDEFSLRRVQ